MAARLSREEIIKAVHDNFQNLGLEALDVANLRIMFSVDGPAEGSIEAPLVIMAELQRQGLIRNIGLSNVTPNQVAEGRKICFLHKIISMYAPHSVLEIV